MSFILDALRKSETDRRRASTPMLSGVPVEIGRQSVPAWLWALIGALTVTVFVLAGAWWNSTRVPQDSPLSASTAAEENPSPTTTLAPPRASIEQPPSPEPTERRASAANIPASTVTEPPSPNPVPAEPVAERAQPSLPVDTTETALADPAAESLPTASELAAAGVQLPNLSLELHVYHPEPASRWVYINGARYTEGRRLNNGPQLVEVVPEGVILRHEGRPFLLLSQ